MRLADVQVIPQERTVVVRLTGELDLSNAASIGDAITAAMPNAAHALIIDLGKVDYLDSAGIHLVYRLRERLQARGQGLRLVVPASSPAADALRMAGVLHHVETAETMDAAMQPER